MESQTFEKQVSALRVYLSSNTCQESKYIKPQITLSTLINCIFDSHFTVLSQQKLKFLQLFKFKVLDSVQQTQHVEQNYNNLSRVSLSNIVCPLKLLIQQNKVFLFNQNQWRSYLDFLLKLILGKGYSFSLSSQKKYSILKIFLKNITSFKEKIDTPKKILKSSSTNDLFHQPNENDSLAQKIQNLKQILSFISGLKSQSMFRQLFRTCPSLQNYHLLFDLCFVFLCHSHVRKVGDNDQKVIENFLNQFCLHSTIDESNVEVYFKLLKNYTNLFFKDISQSMINLLLKASSIMFIKKINHQDGEQNPQNKRQIDKIKQKLNLIIGQFGKSQLLRTSKKNDRSTANLKNFEYFFIANALMGKNFQLNLSKRLDIEFDNKIMLKMFNTLNLVYNIKDSYHFFNYLTFALSFINSAIQKARKYPPKVLRFALVQSFLSINIVSQCQISVKIKIQNFTKNLILFESSFKNKRIQIIQKFVGPKLIGFTYSETVKNQTKFKESQHCFEFETCQEFLLTYEKSKLTISYLKHIKSSIQPVKLFEIDKFQTVNSRLSIGGSQKQQNDMQRIEEIQRLNICSKSVKKDKSQTIEKVNLLDLITKNLYKGQINAKSNQLRVYGIKMKKISLIQYPTDILFFSSCYNIKYILEKIFSCILSHFLTKKQQVDKLVQKRLIQATLKEFIMLLSQIQTKKSTLNNTMKIIFAVFLEKFQIDCKDSQQRKNMFIWILQLLQMLETSFGRVYYDDSESLFTIFFSSIMTCSFSLFILTIEHFLENLQKFFTKSFQNSLQIIQKLTLQASLLVSDIKITKQDKNLLIQKIDMLFKLVRQNLANKALQKDEKNVLENAVKLVIEILTLERYDNETHQKMRRFKLSFILINFIRNTFQVIDSDFDQRGSLGKSILKLSAHKVQELRIAICYDEQETKAKIMDDMQIKYEDSFIFQGATVDSLIEDICEISMNDFVSNRHVHQVLKDKMYIFSSYLDLYYHVGNFIVILVVIYQKKSSLEGFLYYLEKIMKHFDPEFILPPSLFFSELITKAWLYFLGMFEKSNTQNNDQDTLKIIFSTIQILGKYNFDLINANVLIKIVNCFMNHPLFLLSSSLNWKLQVRLNNLIQSPWLVNLVEKVSEKMAQFSQKTQKNVQKSLFTLLFRTILTPQFLSQIQGSTLHQIFVSKQLLIPIQILIISRQLSNCSITLIFGPPKCRQLFKTYLERIKTLISQFQQKAKTFRSQKGSDKQTSISYEINIKKFQIIYNHLREQYNKICIFPSRDFDSEILYNSQALQAIEDYAGRIVRLLEIQALQNEQTFKTQIRSEKEKMSFLSQAKVEPPKEDRDKINKSKIKKSINLRDQHFKKFPSGNQVRMDKKNFKRPMQLNVITQNFVKQGSTQIFINHIQNLTQIIQSLQRILTDDKFHGAICFNQSKIFFTNDNLNQIEDKNAHLEYVIDEYCDINGFKPLIKRKEVNVNLPKMKSNFLQETKDTYCFKSILDHMKSLKSMCDFKQVKAIPNSPKFRPPQTQIDSYVDSFKVTFITSSQFYQGQLRVYNYHLCKFVQNKDIDPNIYGNLMALESQQRKKSDILKAPLSFYIKFDKNQAQFIKKSYLKVQNSIQIYASNRSFLFVFKDQKQRDSFCKKIYEKNEINPQNVDIYIKLWQKGIISNFQYLMFLNKYSQRSFSDISQYYVFPWTVCNYKTERMDNEFLRTTQNFRDLSEPIGKINKVKFKKIKSHFQSSKRFMDADRPNFLYGSFYSNPAITSYYLIRLYPFSAHQHQLQNYRFDHPDRLFGSVEKNFDAVYNITGDFKELIPQFYSSPYFLKNRNRYNFGLTQSKLLIDDVELPSWVRTQTPQQFIFRMRKCLESEQVTINLQKWIDLTFGVYAERSKAMTKDNLYNEHVYGIEQNLKDNKNLSFFNKYLKEFGQIPKIILKSEHPESLMKKKGRKIFKKYKSFQDLLKETLTKQDIKEYNHDECEKLNEETQSSLIKFVSKQKTEKEQKSKQYPKSTKNIPQSTKIDQTSETEQPFLILKQNCLIANCSYGFGYYIFPLDNKDSTQYKSRLTKVEKCDFLTIDHAKSLQTYLLTIENGSLFGYRFVNKMTRGFKSSIGQRFEIETRQDVKMVRSMGSYLILVNSLDQVKLYTTQLILIDKKMAQQISKDSQRIKNQDILKLQNFNLTHSKTIKADFEQISDIYVNSYLSIFCIRNKTNTFYIFDARQNMEIDFRTSFQVYLMFEEKIKHVLIHNMGYILILTSKNRFLLFNILAELVLNVLVSFDVVKDFKQMPQTIEAVCFWSQQASDIVFSTNKNIIYKVDIFDMAERRQRKTDEQKQHKKCINIDEFEILKQLTEDLIEKYEMSDNKEKIVDIKIDRTGRHWKMYCLGQNGNILTLKNKYYDITKCMKIFLRERQD